MKGDIILNNFFIKIGGLVLNLINFIFNLSLNEIKQEDRAPREIDTSIFAKLNFEVDDKPQKNTENIVDKIRDLMLEYLLKRNILISLLIILILLFFISPIEIAGIFLTLIVMGYVFIFTYPKMKEKQNYSDLNQELPYALRHMGIELKSGKGLHDVLITIRNANYGSLSREMNRVLEEIKFGKTTEESLIEMSHRVKSEGLSRAIHQIIGTLRVGGNLSHSLDVIAKDISFDMKIRLKEYSQKLNSFIMIYTFIAILAPVISLIMLMAGSTVMGDIISSNILFLIYSVFFPMIVVIMGVFIKRLEPQI